MSRLSEYLGTPADRLADEEIILLRLMGRPFGRPVDGTLGERPEDALLDYLQLVANDGLEQSTATLPFLDLIARLIDPQRVPPQTDFSAFVDGLSENSRCSLAFTMVRLLDDARLEVDSRTLRAVAERFSPGPKLEGAALSVYWRLVLSTFAEKAIRDEAIAVCQEMVIRDEFLGGPMIATAGARPSLFFGTIVPALFEALRNGATNQNRVLDSVRQSMRAGFRSLYTRLGKSSRTQEKIVLLASQLRVLVASGSHTKVAHAVLDGAAEATNIEAGSKPSAHLPKGCMPFAHFSLLESAFSQGCAQAARPSAQADRRIRKILSGYTTPVKQCALGSSVDPVLATNLIPYSEGVYFLIWRALLSEAGVALEPRPAPWGHVIQSLLYEKILSFAVLNDYVPDKLKDSTKIQVTNQPLLTYNYFPISIRRDILEAHCERAPASEAEEILRVLSGEKSFSSHTLKYFPYLLRSLRKHPLALVADSEIMEVAVDTLGDGLDIVSTTSDEAVELLVDGKVGWAVLGGLQADYLRRRFGASTATLLEMERPTPAHLWFQESTFGARKYDEFVAPLLEAWRQTCLIWHDASRGGQNAAELQRWIMNLAHELNELGGLRTPISSWNDLRRLYERHDTLHQPTHIERPTNIARERTHVVTMEEMWKLRKGKSQERL